MVDANLIGGFVVRIGDNQIDASVATQLRKLKQELTQ
jgi:F-type H+-transporting ATPase subunit delta